MKITAGNIELQVNWIYQENSYQNGKIQDVLYIHTPAMLTDDETQAILNNPIAFLPDDNGEATQTFEGFNTIKGYSISLVRETDAEKEIQALRAEQEAMKQEKAMLLAAKEDVVIE